MHHSPYCTSPISRQTYSLSQIILLNFVYKSINLDHSRWLSFASLILECIGCFKYWFDKMHEFFYHLSKLIYVYKFNGLINTIISFYSMFYQMEHKQNVRFKLLQLIFFK